MRGINRDRRQQWVHFALKIIFRKGAGFSVELDPVEQTDAMLAQFRQQLLVPAVVLGGHKGVNVGCQRGQRLVGPEAVEAGLAIAVFNALHEPGLADLNIFVEI